MSAPPTFDGVHVVSDLHLGGGSPERQIFDQAKEFGQLVAWLLKKPKGEQHALVINGDLVDFLAEPNATYFDPAGASAKLDRIFRDPSFVPVWDALKEFVGTENRSLAITLGNHDLELDLPWVREQLLQELSGGDAAARGRVTLAFEADGYACRVGGADILCVHGNEVDDWNVTDYDALRRVGRTAGGGGSASAWTPNAGTRLVIDVMNAVKKKYAFVDLLKPETAGVIPTVLILDPGQAARVGAAIPSGLRLGWDKLRRATGFLSEEEQAALAAGRAAPADVLRAMLGDTFGAALPGLDARSLDALLLLTEQRYVAGVDPLTLLAADDRLEFLGYGQALWDLITRKGEDEVLRQALERLGSDTGFDLKQADDTYRALNDKVPEDVEFLAAGHTHLERALPLRGGRRFYYNSGTWVRLLRLTADVLGDAGKFRPFYDAIAQGSMKALDGAKGRGGEVVVLRRPAVVTFWADDEGTHGELRHMAGGKPQPVDGSHFVRS